MFASLLVAIFLIPLATKQGSETKQESEIDFLTVYYGGGTHKLLSGTKSVFSPYSANFGIRLIDLEFLSYREVREFLEVSEPQIEELAPYLKKYVSFHLEWRHELGCRCEPVREATKAKCEQLRKEVNDERVVEKALSDSQLKKLRQLERRFVLLGFRSFAPSARRSVSSVSCVNLSTPTRLKVKELIKRHDKRQRDQYLKWYIELFDLFEDHFDENQINSLKRIVTRTGVLSSNELVRHGQLAQFYDFGQSKNADQSSLKSSLEMSMVSPLMLPNGRFASERDFNYRYELRFGPSKWLAIVELLGNADNSWFEVVDFQQERFEQLVEHDKPEKYGGSVVIRKYKGHEKIIEAFRSAPEPSIMTRPCTVNLRNV